MRWKWIPLLCLNVELCMPYFESVIKLWINLTVLVGNLLTNCSCSLIDCKWQPILEIAYWTKLNDSGIPWIFHKINHWFSFNPLLQFVCLQYLSPSIVGQSIPVTHQSLGLITLSNRDRWCNVPRHPQEDLSISKSSW